MTPSRESVFIVAWLIALTKVLVLLTLNIDILSLKYQGDRHRGLAEFIMIQFLTEI